MAILEPFRGPWSAVVPSLGESGPSFAKVGRLTSAVERSALPSVPSTTLPRRWRECCFGLRGSSPGSRLLQIRRRPAPGTQHRPNGTGARYRRCVAVCVPHIGHAHARAPKVLLERRLVPRDGSHASRARGSIRIAPLGRRNAGSCPCRTLGAHHHGDCPPPTDPPAGPCRPVELAGDASPSASSSAPRYRRVGADI